MEVGVGMKNIRIGVVEDDPQARKIVLTFLKRFSEESDDTFTIAVFDDALSLIDRYRPVYDILLMDIEMSGMNGMDAARWIRKCDQSVIIVFITAAPQYAISGYEVQALSYLLKPVPWFAFKQELERSIGMVRHKIGSSMLVETRSQGLRLELSHVIYFESIRHTIVIHTLSDRLSISSTLKELESELREQSFFRSNACYLVNLGHVMAVEDQDCVMTNGERLRISRPRKKAFLAVLAEYLGAMPR